jgi:hypothetical protein
MTTGEENLPYEGMKLRRTSGNSRFLQRRNGGIVFATMSNGRIEQGT